ncbi:MAG: bacillithiol biosynthesis protein BshC, partial [Gemmatimonadaceae bacterium]
SKALSALALADAIEVATGIPAAPIFWAATDDSDFAEAASTYVAVPGGLETLTLPDPAHPGSSLRDVPLGNVSPLVESLARGAGAAVYADALDAVREAYHEGETIGGAYVELLRRVLEPLGVAVLDAGHAAVRRAAAPMLHQALARGVEIERALVARAREIETAGYSPQVSLVPGLTLVFDARDGDRRRVPLREAGEVASRGSDEALGPNVLLRPLVESAILPTVAYVAGPGELAYFAQVSAAAVALERPTPLAVPRWSGTIIEPHIRRILERYSLGMEDLRDPHGVETGLAASRVSAGVREALERSRAHVAEMVRDLTAALEGPPSVVDERVITGAGRGLEHRLDRLTRRVTAAVKRREMAMMRDIATARAALYPRGAAQERALNLIPLLARNGPRLLDLMREAAAEHAGELIGGAAVALAGPRSEGAPPSPSRA